MNHFEVLELTQEAMLIVIMVSMPAVLASLVVGLVVAIFSATTQIQEQTLSFAPKIIAVYGSLIVFGGVVGALLINFAKKCFSLFLHNF